MKSGTINRDLTEKDTGGMDVAQGTPVWEFEGITYGCVSPHGIAVSFKSDGSTPFQEVPRDSVDWSA